MSYAGGKVKDFITNIVQSVAPIVGGPLVGLAVNLIHRLIGGNDKAKN